MKLSVARSDIAHFLTVFYNTVLISSSIHQYLQNLDMTLSIYLLNNPNISVQTHPHQWRFIYNWNYSKSQKVQNSKSESGSHII